MKRIRDHYFGAWLKIQKQLEYIKQEDCLEFDISSKEYNEYYNEYMLLLLDYVKEWKNKDLSTINIPQTVKDEVNDYLNDNNPLKNFLDTYYTVTKKYHSTTQ